MQRYELFCEMAKKNVPINWHKYKISEFDVVGNTHELNTVGFQLQLDSGTNHLPFFWSFILRSCCIYCLRYIKSCFCIFIYLLYGFRRVYS